MAALFASEFGGDGFVVISSPLLGADAAELPIALVASTVAITLSPHARL